MPTPRLTPAFDAWQVGVWPQLICWHPETRSMPHRGGLRKRLTGMGQDGLHARPADARQKT